MNSLAQSGAGQVSQRDRIALYLFIYAAIAIEGIPINFVGVKWNAPIFIAACLIIIGLKFRTMIRNSWVLFTIPCVLFLLYGAYSATSTLWSFVGLESALQSLPIILMVFAAAGIAKIPVGYTVGVIVRATLIICALSWVLGVLVPSVGAVIPPGWRLNGVLGHPQRLALVVISTGLLLLVATQSGTNVFKSKIGLLGASAVLLATLLATQTRAFSTYGLVAFAFAYFMFARPRIKTALVGLAAVVAVGVILNPDFLEVLYEREGSNTETLSGRTTIWSNTVILAFETFWQGHGFASFFSPLTANFFRNYVAPHAHNDVLNVFFETGAVGVGLLGLFVLLGLVQFIRGRLLFSGYLLVFCVMCGITGSVLGAKLSFPMALLLLTVIQESYSRLSIIRAARLTKRGQVSATGSYGASIATAPDKARGVVAAGN